MGIGSYLIELDRWNIKNDKMDAVNTSIGINNALLWASAEGYAEAVLPNGVYLIDETNPIQPPSFLTFNLGGATLRIRDNNLPRYAVVSFKNRQKHSRITNGKIEGDRYTHNYTGGGIHESGLGIDLRHGVSYIAIDHLEIYNTTGDAIFGITSYGSLGGGFPQLQGNLEQGGINTENGTLTPDANRIRSKVKIPMNSQIKNLGYFGLYGDSYGRIGKEIITDTYDIVFYKSDDSFLSSKTNLNFFDEVEVPQEAGYAKAVLHQSNVPSLSGNTIVIRTPEFPRHIYIENCHLHHCRRLGVAVCGMKHCYISRCEIHDISGTAPQGAIDIEDGYDINQYIYLDGNNIYDNESYNIIVVAGRHISITNNKIRSGIFTINPAVDKVIVSNNFFHDTRPLLSGDTLFTSNHVYNSRVRLLGDGEAVIDNCFFHNSPLNFRKEKAYVAAVNNCKFLFDNDFYTVSVNPGSPIIFSAEPQTISNTTFEGSGREAFTVVPESARNWILNNVTFKDIKHSGDRITVLPPGTYNGCHFINSGRLRLDDRSDGLYTKCEFNDCYFEFASPLFYIRPTTKIDYFKVHNCFFHNSLNSSNAFFLDGSWGIVDFSDNVFHYLDSSSGYMVDITNTATADSVHFLGNTFIATKTMTSVRANNPSIPLLFKDNILIKTTMDLHNTHLKLNNIIDFSLQS